jgi:predicted amidohydrolase
VKTLTIALLQVSSEGYDQAANLSIGAAACRRAAGAGADVVVFPEMWNIGYRFGSSAPPVGPAGDDRPAGDEDLERDLAAWRAQAVERDSPFVRHFATLAAELEVAIAVTYLEAWRGGPRNSVTLFDRRGDEALTYAKVFTCDFCWPESALTPGDAFPVVDLETAAGPVRVGAMICFDREFPEAARQLAAAGAELLLVPNACEMEDNRLGQLRARAFENMAVVALANYPSPAQNGHSVAFDPYAFDDAGGGRDTTMVEAGEGEEIVLARLDLDRLRRWRRREAWKADRGRAVGSRPSFAEPAERSAPREGGSP